MVEDKWNFKGTPWEFVHLVRHACVVYECVKRKRNGILEILMDDEVFEKAADEFGITYDTIKNEMRINLDFADRLDEIMENCKK